MNEKDDQIKELNFTIQLNENSIKTWKKKCEDQLRDSSINKDLSIKNEEILNLKSKIIQITYEFDQISEKFHSQQTNNLKIKNELLENSEKKDIALIEKEQLINKLNSQLEFANININSKDQEINFFKKLTNKKNNNVEIIENQKDILKDSENGNDQEEELIIKIYKIIDFYKGKKSMKNLTQAIILKLL